MKKALSVILACLMIALLLTPCLYAADKPVDACTAWGDMDGDNKTTSGDARLVLRQSVGLEKYPEEATRRCDIDKDNKITSADARFVLRCSVGLEFFAQNRDRFTACDMDRDGCVTSSDARTVLRTAVGLVE